jgi:hypothetical protein
MMVLLSPWPVRNQRRARATEIQSNWLLGGCNSTVKPLVEAEAMNWYRKVAV